MSLGASAGLAPGVGMQRPLDMSRETDTPLTGPSFHHNMSRIQAEAAMSGAASEQHAMDGNRLPPAYGQPTPSSQTQPRAPFNQNPFNYNK